MLSSHKPAPHPMKFLHQSIEAKKKEIIEVEIDTATKVKFMTGKEFKAYKGGKTHSFYGGLFEESPVRFVVTPQGSDPTWTRCHRTGPAPSYVERMSSTSTVWFVRLER